MKYASTLWSTTKYAAKLATNGTGRTCNTRSITAAYAAKNTSLSRHPRHQHGQSAPPGRAA